MTAAANPPYAETHNHPQPIEGCWRCDATWLKGRLHSDGSCRQCNTTHALLDRLEATTPSAALLDDGDF